MNINDENIAVDETDNTSVYADGIEGTIQMYLDRSLAYDELRKSAKTKVKRDFYTKKLQKNNRDLYRLIFRTPNAYNPLLKMLKERPELEDIQEENTDQIQESTSEEVREG